MVFSSKTRPAPCSLAFGPIRRYFTISTERIATWRTKQLLGLPAHFARGGRTIQLVEPREVVLVRPPRLEQPLAHLRLEGEGEGWA